MRSLVTGITGFVGSHLAKSLVERGDEVYGFARRRADNKPPARLVEMGVYDKVQIIEGDLTDLTSIIGAVNYSIPDEIYHLGAQTYVPRSFTDPLETMRVNCTGTHNLLEAVRLNNGSPKVIFAGSSEEYGLQIAHEAHYNLVMLDRGYVFPEPDEIPELPIDETNYLRPMSPYADSKVYGDMLTRTYHSAYGIRGVVSRAFNHEGAGRGDNFVTSVIVRQCLALSRGEQDAIHIGNVNAFRDWSHVDDVVEGYKLLAERGRNGDVYVQGSMRTNSVLTYIMWTLGELGYNVDTAETFTGVKYGEMAEPATDEWYGADFEKTRADALLLGGRLEFTLRDKGLKLHTDKGIVRVVFDQNRFRPADVPILLSDTKKIQSIGFKPEHSVKDIIRDQLEYYGYAEETDGGE